MRESIKFSQDNKKRSLSKIKIGLNLDSLPFLITLVVYLSEHLPRFFKNSSCLLLLP